MFIRILLLALLVLPALARAEVDRTMIDHKVDKLIALMSEHAILVTEPERCRPELTRSVQLTEVTPTPETEAAHAAEKREATAATRACLGEKFVTILDHTTMQELNEELFLGTATPFTISRVTGTTVITVHAITADFAEALERVRASLPNPRAYVLDLRGVPGGVLASTLRAIVPYVKDTGATLVTYHTRSGTSEITAASVTIGCRIKTKSGKVIEASCKLPDRLGPGTAVGDKVALLVDAKTSSAAELFVAALAEHSNAVVFGTRTYGKGVSQTPYYAPQHGFGIMFSNLEYRLGDGTRIHEHGVLPDHEVADSRARGHDDQLARAIKWLAGEDDHHARVAE